MSNLIKCHECIKKNEIIDELLAACLLAQKYVAKMVADDIQTVVPPQIALNRIERAIIKATH